MMQTILGNIHYMPDHWKQAPHTAMVYKEFTQVFQYTVVSVTCFIHVDLSMLSIGVYAVACTVYCSPYKQVTLYNTARLIGPNVSIACVWTCVI